MREGDTNTEIFQSMANSNRRNNSVANLMVDGVLSTDQDLIVEYITNFYMNYFWSGRFIDLALMYWNSPGYPGKRMSGWRDLLRKHKIMA